jgi:hypothetical protein
MTPKPNFFLKNLKTMAEVPITPMNFVSSHQANSLPGISLPVLVGASAHGETGGTPTKAFPYWLLRYSLLVVSEAESIRYSIAPLTFFTPKLNQPYLCYPHVTCKPFKSHQLCTQPN